MLVNTKQQNNKETDNCSSSVTDGLYVHSALPPAPKTHSSYPVKSQKEVKSTPKQPNCKKNGAAHAKNDSMKKL